MLRAINGLMGVISGLKLKKNEAVGVGGKREVRRKCLSWEVIEYCQHHPRFHTSQLDRGHCPWSMLCLQSSPYPTDMRFWELMLMSFILVGLLDAFL